MLYGMALMTVDEKLALFFYALFYFCVDFMTLLLFIYSRVYADTYRHKAWMRPVTYILFLTDAIVLFSNLRVQNVFHVAPMTDQFGNVYYGVKSYGILYGVHTLICYALAAACLIVLLVRRSKCPRIFQVNYSSIIITLILTAIANIMFFKFEFIYDFSLIGYTALCCAITYFTFFHIPAGLVEKMLALFIKTIDDGVVCYDVKGKCIHANEQAKKILHVSELSALDKKLQGWLNGKNLRDIHDIAWKEQFRIDGKVHFFQFQYKKMIYENHEIGSFFLLHDRTEEVERVKSEQYKANHDALTGIYNREYFYECAEQMLRENSDTAFYIVCSDIRDFKIVNDVYGSKKGDDILIKQAESLKQKTPAGCIYGRLAGDRFALLLPKELFQENIFRREISRIEQIEGNSSFRLRMYMGIYEVDDRNTPVAVMCDRAIMAIKTIKDDVSNRISYYDKELRETALKDSGIGIAFSANGSSGGTDIIAAIINKYRDVSLGRVVMACDMIIITSSYFVLQDWEKVVYGYVTLYVCSFVLDQIVNSAHQSVQFFIISKHYKEIGEHINKDMHRGVTVLDGTGLYTGNGVKMMFVLAKKRESTAIFRLIKDIDPDAFVSQSTVIGVYGKGFDHIKVK